MSEVMNQLAFELGQPAENGDGYLFTQEQFDEFCNASTAELLPLPKEMLAQQLYELEHRGARYRGRWEKITSRLEQHIQQLEGHDEQA